jgi:hypothetical protein
LDRLSRLAQNPSLDNNQKWVTHGSKKPLPLKWNIGS